MGGILEGIAVGYGCGRLLGDIAGDAMERHELANVVFEHGSVPDVRGYLRYTHHATRKAAVMGGIAGGAMGGAVSMFDT